MHIDCKEDYYYQESKRLRHEVLQQAEALKGNPLRVLIDNGIKMEVEITKYLLRPCANPDRENETPQKYWRDKAPVCFQGVFCWRRTCLRCSFWLQRWCQRVQSQACLSYAECSPSSPSYGKDKRLISILQGNEWFFLVFYLKTLFSPILFVLLHLRLPVATVVSSFYTERFKCVILSPKDLFVHQRQ